MPHFDSLAVATAVAVEGAEKVGLQSHQQPLSVAAVNVDEVVSHLAMAVA